ncbi:mitofilin family membrane protein [Martelella sp. HB161492]|uniref:COG4223 family protein n=1 Tax=Martelella sp. HB161492 TaxID=2720726 RepID=UPI00158FFC60|nr:mitofilin family membrane protein [Martelella sp. HB161492]
MVSDKSSRPEQDEKAETGAEPAPVKPRENEEDVKAAMADIAAAIHRHGNGDAGPSPTKPETEETDMPSEADAAKAETTASEPEKPETVAPAPAAPAKAPGAAAYLAAGIAGGIVALACAGALQYAGFLGTPGNRQANSQTAASIAALQSDLAQVKASLAAAPAEAQTALSTLGGRLDTMDAKIADLSSRPTGGSGVPGQTVEALKADLATLSTTVQANATSLANQSQAEQAQGDVLSKLESQVAALDKKVNDPGKELMIARAIAAAGLKAAIDRGGSFASELQTYASVAPDDPALSALKSLAASGIPTRDALLAQFETLATPIINAADAPPADESVTTRLWNSARHLISIRPVGDVEGSSTGAIVARIENDLETGKLQAAAKEWSALPAAGQDASRDFKTALDARIKAEGLLGQMLSDAASAGKPVTAGADADAANAAETGTGANP